MSEERLAIDIVTKCKGRRIMLATAESCTGGLVSAAITAVPGSSAVFDRGFVTYSYDAKTQQVGVPMAHTVNPGAVSELVAREMAEGAVAKSKAQIAVSTTGIAGPTGGTPEKPVGLVYIAAHLNGHETKVREHRFGEGRPGIGRAEVRRKSVEAALELLIELLDETRPSAG